MMWWKILVNISNIEGIQLFGDGRKLVMLMKMGKEELGYEFREIFVNDVTVTTNPFQQETDFGFFENDRTYRVPYDVTVDLSFKVSSDNLAMMYGKKLLVDCDLFKEYSIKDLFKVINNKIKNR